MGSGKTLDMITFSAIMQAARRSENAEFPRETRERDRSLAGKKRRRARRGK